MGFDMEMLRGAGDPLTEALETVEVKPRKTDISVRSSLDGPWWRDGKAG